jgi:hypothetical protein
MRWTRKLARRRTRAGADGEVVWSRRPDAGVKLARNISRATVARKPGHRGERDISRKNHCAGKAGLPPLDLYARVRFFVHSCTRDRGCSAHPAFPAPSCSFQGGGNRRKARAYRAARSGICVCKESGYCEERSVRVDFRYTNQRGQRVSATPSYPVKPTLPNRGTEFCI